jgi:hypothetical protein
MLDESGYETIDIPESGYNINSQQALDLNIHVEGQYNVDQTTTTQPKYVPPTTAPIPEDDGYLPEQHNPFFNFNSLKEYIITNILKIFK